MNHLTWIRSVTVDGQERLPDLLEAPDAEDFLGSHYYFSFDCVKALNAIPSSYLNYYYATDEAIAKELIEYRAAAVMRIEHELLEMYKDPHSTASRHYWSSEVVPGTARLRPPWPLAY